MRPGLKCSLWAESAGTPAKGIAAKSLAPKNLAGNSGEKAKAVKKRQRMVSDDESDDDFIGNPGVNKTRKTLDSSPEIVISDSD